MERGRTVSEKLCLVDHLVESRDFICFRLLWLFYLHRLPLLPLICSYRFHSLLLLQDVLHSVIRIACGRFFELDNSRGRHLLRL